MTTAGTWYPPSCGTGGFLIELTNPPFTMTTPTDHTPQTPELPPEVFAELLEKATKQRLSVEGIARLAYAAGAKAGAKDEYQRGGDAELEARCEWLERGPFCFSAATKRALRAARRPKPPSLKEQVLQAFEELIRHGPDHAAITTIRHALESLPDPQ